MPHVEERRRAPRIQVLGRLHGHVVSIDTPVSVREVSLVGLSFSAGIPFPVGAVHEFRLTLGDDSTVHLRGLIVRCQDVGPVEGARTFVMGVQFLDDEHEEHAGLGDLLDKVK